MDDTAYLFRCEISSKNIGIFLSKESAMKFIRNRYGTEVKIEMNEEFGYNVFHASYMPYGTSFRIASLTCLPKVD